MNNESIALYEINNAYCDNCEVIRPVKFEGYVAADVDNQFLGGDVVCQDCYFIVATLYKPKSEAINEP